MFPNSSEIKELSRHIPKSKLRPIGGQKKRDQIPYERVLVEQNPDKTNHFTYRTGRTRIVPWIQALIQFYSSECTTGECLWFNEKGQEVSQKSDNIAWVTLNIFTDVKKPFHMFTVHLKKGLIDAQVSDYSLFGRNDFPEILKIVDKPAVPSSSSSPSKDAAKLNNTVIECSPSSGVTNQSNLNSTVRDSNVPAGLPEPNVSPVKPDTDGDEYWSAQSEDESDTEDRDEKHSKESSYVPELDKTLAAACFNLDNTVVSLRDELLNTCRAQASDITSKKTN